MVFLLKDSTTHPYSQNFGTSITTMAKHPIQLLQCETSCTTGLSNFCTQAPMIRRHVVLRSIPVYLASPNFSVKAGISVDISNLPKHRGLL